MSRSSTRLTVVLTAAMLAAVVAWHPAEQLDPVRRAVGLGPERPLTGAERRTSRAGPSPGR